jgi:hypothetical protein
MGKCPPFLSLGSWCISTASDEPKQIELAQATPSVLPVVLVNPTEDGRKLKALHREKQAQREQIRATT